MLTAAAMRTTTIRLGTLLTPLPRRRPWDLAGQVAALDNLSDGRVTLSVGLGAVHEGWLAFEQDPGRRVRAERLDEGLAVLRGLLAGQPFRFEGSHYTVTPTDFMIPPGPVQRPHVPIWVVGGWPSRVSMRRAALADGWLPNLVSKDGPPGSPAPDTIRAGIAAIREVRAAEGLLMDGYDVITEGVTPGGRSRRGPGRGRTVGRGRRHLVDRGRLVRRARSGPGVRPQTPDRRPTPLTVGWADRGLG